MESLKNIFVNSEEDRMRAGWRILFQTLILIAFAIGMAGVLEGIAFLFGMENPPNIGVLASGIAIAGSVLLANKWIDKRTITSFGMEFSGLARTEFFVGCGMAFIAQAVIFAIDVSAGFVSVSGNVFTAPDSMEVMKQFGLFFLSMLAVGFYEEMWSRGYHLRNLAEGFFGKRVSLPVALIFATAISSSIFGLLHAGNPNVSPLAIFNIVLAGVMLALPMLLTGRLWMSIGLHFSWNFTMAGIFGLPVSGIDANVGLIQLEILDESILSGGNFGPEAGLVGVFGMLLICVMIIAWQHQRNGQIEIHDKLVKYDSSLS